MEHIFLGAERSGGKNLTLSVTYYEITDESPLGDLSSTLRIKPGLQYAENFLHKRAGNDVQNHSPKL